MLHKLYVDHALLYLASKYRQGISGLDTHAEDAAPKPGMTTA